MTRGDLDAAALGPIEQVEQALQRLQLRGHAAEGGLLFVGIGLVPVDRQVRQERGEDGLVGPPDDLRAVDLLVDRHALVLEDRGKSLQVDRVAMHQGAVHIEDQSFQHRAVSQSVMSQSVLEHGSGE